MGPASQAEHTVHILEIGYTSDTNHTAKQNDKAQQHEYLATALADASWQVRYTTQEAIISLGFDGTVYSEGRTYLRTPLAD